MYTSIMLRASACNHQVHCMHLANTATADILPSRTWQRLGHPAQPQDLRPRHDGPGRKLALSHAHLQSISMQD